MLSKIYLTLIAAFRTRCPRKPVIFGVPIIIVSMKKIVSSRNQNSPVYALRNLTFASLNQNLWLNVDLDRDWLRETNCRIHWTSHRRASRFNSPDTSSRGL